MSASDYVRTYIYMYTYIVHCTYMNDQPLRQEKAKQLRLDSNPRHSAYHCLFAFFAGNGMCGHLGVV